MKRPVGIMALAFCGAVSQLRCASSQTPAKKSYTLHGKVTAINAGEKSLMVDGDAVPGWMDAMKMSYDVDDAAVLKTIKPGDRIAATVYDGDLVLHKIYLDKAPKK